MTSRSSCSFATSARRPGRADRSAGRRAAAPTAAPAGPASTGFEQVVHRVDLERLHGVLVEGRDEHQRRDGHAGVQDAAGPPRSRSGPASGRPGTRRSGWCAAMAAQRPRARWRPAPTMSTPPSCVELVSTVPRGPAARRRRRDPKRLRHQRRLHAETSLGTCSSRNFHARARALARFAHERELAVTRRRSTLQPFVHVAQADPPLDIGCSSALHHEAHAVVVALRSRRRPCCR